MAFTGKVALVTGGASGMGRLASQRMADAGVTVAAVDLNEDGLRETAEGRSAIRTWPLDVTNAAAVEATVKEVEAELGPIDRVFNGAAIMPTGLLLDQSPELINRIMDVNYGGTVNVTKAVLPGLLQRGRGDLVNFASVAGWLPTLHFGAYNASKFAVVAFTEVLYHENRNKGVRFACVCPPPVDTPLLDQAASKPKILDEVPAIPPEQVLDRIETCLDKGKLFVFPDATAAWSVRGRRWLPGVAWRRVHKIEGF